MRRSPTTSCAHALKSLSSSGGKFNYDSVLITITGEIKSMYKTKTLAVCPVIKPKKGQKSLKINNVLIIHSIFCYAKSKHIRIINIKLCVKSMSIHVDTQ